MVSCECDFRGLFAIRYVMIVIYSYLNSSEDTVIDLIFGEKAKPTLLTFLIYVTLSVTHSGIKLYVLC